MALIPPPLLEADMLRYPLKYLVEDVDRHGNIRLYVRRNGKKVRLRSPINTPEFLAEYQAALLHLQATRELVTAKPGSAPPGSFRALCIAYLGSPEFARLDADSTRKWHRRELEKISEAYGHKPFALMDSKGVKKLRDERADMPGAANNRLKALKALFAWAIEKEEASHNPAQAVKLISYKTDGHHAWTLDEVAAYERYHPIGSKPRLAMGLLFYTACRREDVVRLGPQNIRGGRVRFVQAKNESKKPVEIDMPVPMGLREVLDGTAVRHMTFLVTEYGKPFTVAGFGMRFREWCDAAGLPHCSAHGLRKTVQTLLAENEASTHEIQSLSGHSTLAETERYTRSASRKKQADLAVAKLNRVWMENKSVPPNDGVQCPTVKSKIKSTG